MPVIYKYNIIENIPHIFDQYQPLADILATVT